MASNDGQAQQHIFFKFLLIDDKGGEEGIKSLSVLKPGWPVSQTGLTGLCWEKLGFLSSQVICWENLLREHGYVIISVSNLIFVLDLKTIVMCAILCVMHSLCSKWLIVSMWCMLKWWLWFKSVLCLLLCTDWVKPVWPVSQTGLTGLAQVAHNCSCFPCCEISWYMHHGAIIYGFTHLLHPTYAEI